jgi:cytosine/adenosine deaminase-related metal-dependent hydrolase
MPIVIAPAAAATHKYTVMTGGNPIGTLKVVRDVGREAADFKYSDRGSGPALRTVAVLNKSALPIDTRSTGLNSLQLPITDEYRRINKVGRWRTGIDRGSATASGFYLPLEQSPEDWARLVRALQRSGGALRILPAGEARLTRVRTEDAGGTATTLYTISGLDWAPVPVWLDAQNNLFMFNFNRGYLTTIRKGFERHERELIAAQTAAGGEVEHAIAQQVAQQRGTFLIRGAEVFDAENKTVLRDHAVLVRGNRIEWVGPSSAAQTAAGTRIIEAAGKFLMPGMFDMHTHFYSDYFGRLLLGNGVTSVRDLGATPLDRVMARRDAYASGRMLGPRITLSGFIDGPGPRAGPTDAIVSTAEQVRSWVDRYADAGVAYIKIYSSVPHKLVPVAVAAAKARGLRVGGHVPDNMHMQDVVKAGYDEVQHSSYWLDALLPAGTKFPESNSTALIEKFDAMVAGLDLDSGKANELINLLVTHKTIVDPTIVTFEDVYREGRGELPPSLRAVEKWLPPVVRRNNLSGGYAVSTRDAGYLDKQIKLKLTLLKKMWDSGVTIAPGSDTLVRGFPYLRELELYEKAGIPPQDILQMATLGSARIVKQEGDLGSIKAGKLADLVLIDGDPTRGVAELRKPVMVIKDGVVLNPTQLLRPGLETSRRTHP